MDDLTTYRTAEVPYPDRVHVGHGFSGWVDPPTVVASLVDDGVLVPDFRLQAMLDGCNHTAHYHQGENYEFFRCNAIDTRLQAIVDAWNKMNVLDRNHIFNAGGKKLVLAIEDALTEEMSH